MEVERGEQGRALTVEERISERIRSFDIPALLDLLAKEGYGESDIEFRSHRSTLRQQHLVHAIEFTRQPRKRAVITVNMGLLSVQTPLPSFLFQAMDRLEHDAMVDFIGYFDHLLLRTRFAGQFPDRDETLLPGWERSTAHRLRLLRLACPSSLHWLFAKVFPEAEVTVRRETRKQRIESKGIRLGAVALGDGSAVGGFATVPTGGVEVRIHLDESTSGTGIPWAVEARRRLTTRIFPSLAETPLALKIIMALRDQSSHARLHAASYLGYDPLVGGPEHTQEVLLFSGDTAQVRSADAR
ncbi:hypothetical protein DRW03_28750 [Corallococcus sp. H22C18031201]|uniref:hypothetical protein n=1 Tax=Citreicoccus inhibens TaxID=2849499 RepID=UPI000E763100|nr:hypothetical protein [Citreicoccus inhibens]MBU8899463.1 hypothetical protein [Citreicoccus inhibens]RJS17056.1 hypothetical protein DRW03_28750 [Corallococcus sp. H22C18031201]